ncbi:PDxFFG protein [Mycoplasma elephantis]|uniref:PDxFFG protein n=1 Tax=Mycoplasma elephantis TaxID=114882 RepID=UPI000484D166|nr:PDxFFG protein [Mycoplasma elephantis]
MKKLSLKRKTFLSVGITLAAIGTIFLGSYLYSKIDKRPKNINKGTKSNAFNDFKYNNGVYESNTQGIFCDKNKKPLAYVKEKKVDGKITKNTICFYNEDKEYTEKEFFNEYLRRYNNETPVLKVQLGPTEFVNEYIEAVGVQDFMDYVDWFIQNVAWGPDVLTLERFKIAKGVNKTGSTITLGGHVCRNKETKEITFWPDSFFGSLPLFSTEAGEGNGNDSLLTKINGKSLNNTNVQNLLDEFIITNAIYNYPGDINKTPDYQNSIGQFKNIQLVNLMTNPNLNYSFYEVELTNKKTLEKQKMIMSLSIADVNEARKQVPVKSEFEILDQNIKKVRIVRTNFMKNEHLAYEQKNDKQNWNLSLGYIYSDADEANMVGKYCPYKADSEEYKELLKKHNDDPSKNKHPGKPTERIQLDPSWNDPIFSNIYTNINNYLLSKVDTFKDFVNFKIYLTDFDKLYNSLAHADIPALYKIVTYYNSDDEDIAKKLRRELYLYKKPNANRFELSKSLFKTKSEAKKTFGSNFDDSNIEKVYLDDLILKNKTLSIILEKQDGEKENIEIHAEDNSMNAINQLSNLKTALNYKVAYSPNFLSIANEYNDANGKKVYEFDLYNELYSDLIDIIESEYPYLIQKRTGVHVQKSIDENGAYKFTLENGEYSKLTINDRISFIMLLKAIDPNFEGVGINFLKYVGAHEYGHHSTLENIQNISNKDYSVLIGGIDTRMGPQDQSFYDKDTVREYLLARSSKLDLINKNLAFKKQNHNVPGNYPVFSTVSVENKKLKIVPETIEQIWGSENSHSAKDYYEAFNNNERRALQTIEGLKNAAKLRGLKVYDLFLLNSFDHDSGTISPSISGNAKYYAIEEDADGNVIYNYKFISSGTSQLEKILKDGTNKPIEFIFDSTNNKYVPRVFETKNIFIKVNGNYEKLTIVTKVLINDINGQPIYKIENNEFKGVDIQGNEITLYGELFNAEIQNINSEIEYAVSEMMDTKYYINGWQNSDHRGDDDLKMPTFELKTSWPVFAELKSYYDGVIKQVKANPALATAQFTPELAERFDSDNANYFGNPNYFHFVAARDGQTPVFDPEIKSPSISNNSNKYNKKLDYYKDIPVQENGVSLPAQLSKLFIDYVSTKSYDDEWEGQKDKFGVLRFVKSDNSIYKKYFGNMKDKYRYIYQDEYSLRINEFGVESIFNVLFRDKDNMFDLYANDEVFSDLKMVLPFINSKNIFKLKGMESFNDLVKKQEFMEMVVNRIKQVNNIRLKNEHVSILKKLFGSSIIEKYLKNDTLQFTDIADLVEFMSIDPLMVYGSERNWNIEYVKTKFDLGKFKSHILNNGTDEEKELLKNNDNEQTLANIAMNRFINSDFYAFNTDVDLINFNKNSKNDIELQKETFKQFLNIAYNQNNSINLFKGNNIVSDNEFKTYQVDKRIPISVSILYEKIWEQVKNFMINNPALNDFGQLSLSDIPFIDGKYERLYSEFLSYYNRNIYVVNRSKIMGFPINKIAFTYGFNLDNQINKIAKTFFTSRLNTDLGQVFTDYTYNLPEVLTRDFVQTTYSPSTTDFRTLNKYFKGINEYSTGLEFFVNGQITKHFIDNSANMNKVNKILGELSYMIGNDVIKEKINQAKYGDNKISSAKKTLQESINKYNSLVEDVKNKTYKNEKQDYEEKSTQLIKVLDLLHNVNDVFHMTNLNANFTKHLTASLMAGPFVSEIQSFIDNGVFFKYFGTNRDPKGLNSTNTGLDFKLLNVVPNSGDDVEGTMLLKVRLSIKGTKEEDINEHNSIITTVKFYGFKDKDGNTSVSPVQKMGSSDYAPAITKFKKIVENIEKRNEELTKHSFNDTRKKAEFKELEDLSKEIELQNKKISDLVKPIESKIKRDNSFGLYGTEDFTLSSANPSYIGKVRKQNNGFFKDRWLRKELGWELYDEKGNSIIDKTIRIQDLDGNFVNDRARAFWIYLLKSKGVGDRNITGIWRNKGDDFVAMWGFDKKEIINRIKYLEFEDVKTGEKFYINVNTKNTNNLFYYKNQAQTNSKHTLEDEGYGSWVSDYSIFGNYQNATLVPGHNYLVRFVDKDKKFVKNITTGSKKTLAENGKTYNQSPVTMKTVLAVHDGKEEEVALIEIRDQFNL